MPAKFDLILIEVVFIKTQEGYMSHTEQSIATYHNFIQICTLDAIEMCVGQNGMQFVWLLCLSFL